MLSQNRNWTRRSLVEHAAHVLQEAGIEDALRNAEWMAEEVLQCSRISLYMGSGEPASAEEVERVEKMLARRIRREPLQYILGHADFYGLRLHVTPDVLIPRPETEQAVERALELLRDVQNPRVLDIGTGSGCIPLALKHERPDAAVFACDLSERALCVARDNALRLRLDVSFFRADVLDDTFASEAPASLDLIISNPPYIPDQEADSLEPEVVANEPHLALFSGDDPLTFYKVIARHARTLLRTGGFLVFEAHMDYTREVGELLSETGFTAVRVTLDLTGRPRIVEGRREL